MVGEEGGGSGESAADRSMASLDRRGVDPALPALLTPSPVSAAVGRIVCQRATLQGGKNYGILPPEDALRTTLLHYPPKPGHSVRGGGPEAMRGWRPKYPAYTPMQPPINISIAS